jgi:hypothetical protein
MGELIRKGLSKSFCEDVLGRAGAGIVRLVEFVAAL